MDLASMRRDYAHAGLTESQLAPDWLTQLHRWLGEAADAGLTEPNAMVLATVDEAGRPVTRMVLLKGLDEHGLTFFTNYTSRKARHLEHHPVAAVTLPWHPIGRQVSVTGETERVSQAETEEYWATRPRKSQLGAWASPQSTVVGGREELDAALAAATARFPVGEPVPAPPHWGGIRLRPDTVEFWQGGVGRLHDRLRYRRVSADLGVGADRWVVERLAP